MHPSHSPATLVGTDNRRRLKRIAFSILAVLLPLLAMESISRIVWHTCVYQQPSNEKLNAMIFWEEAWKKDIPYMFTPNSQGRIASASTHINSLGLRGADVDLASSNRRIFCIGDSVTFGYTASSDLQTYPALLERQLRDRGRAEIVMNGGMPRYRTDHMANYYQRYVSVLTPQYVVILGGWNDLNDYVLLPSSDTSSAKLYRWAAEQIYTVKLAVKAAQYLRPKMENPDLRPSAYVAPEGYDRFERNLTHLLQLVHQSHATAYVCTIPHAYGATETLSMQEKLKLVDAAPCGKLGQIRDAVEEFNRRIRRVAQCCNATVIDCSSVNRVDYFADAIHPNDLGDLMIARLVAHALAADLQAADKLGNPRPVGGL